jgi:hypothetical protein
VDIASIVARRFCAFPSEQHVAYYRRQHEWFVADLPKLYTVLYHVGNFDISSSSSSSSSDGFKSLAALAEQQQQRRHTLVETYAQLRHLQEHGPTVHAFPFATAAQLLDVVAAPS